MEINTNVIIDYINDTRSLQCYPVITLNETYVADAINLTLKHFQNIRIQPNIVFINNCFDNFLNNACISQEFYSVIRESNSGQYLC